MFAGRLHPCTARQENPTDRAIRCTLKAAHMPTAPNRRLSPNWLLTRCRKPNLMVSMVWAAVLTELRRKDLQTDNQPQHLHLLTSCSLTFIRMFWLRCVAGCKTQAYQGAVFVLGRWQATSLADC
jgi:hypothetical protein